MAAIIGTLAGRVTQPSYITLPNVIVRPFSVFTVLFGKHTQLPPRPKPPPESEIEESFLKGSGPGGQKINKTSSAVQLKHIPTGIVVKSQATRSRTQNRNIARELLAQRLDELYKGENSRTNIVAEIKKKKQQSAAKKSRRKYRALELLKAGAINEMQQSDKEWLDAAQDDGAQSVEPEESGFDDGIPGGPAVGTAASNPRPSSPVVAKQSP
ncbi:putative peptide chain release factor-like protein, mitochondrial [Ceratocystis fimbriata CBS 114723]|uniref:Putative peptide chain release factor-like protein, mitochondrial n=1 Tax=Ceratocystis fimbriata CBS 114723 TaxID=1035309 RepID=A0A2C5X857_9PEZI|nr:putative peptide chain release factor-like protein, mitochondrial [Ceratocystis fimbriata CBS 114723]